MMKDGNLWNIWTPNHLHLLAEGEGDNGGSGDGSDSGDGASGDGASGDGGSASGDSGDGGVSGDGAAAAGSGDGGNSAAGGSGDQNQGDAPDIGTVMGSEKWIEHVPQEHLKAAQKFKSLGAMAEGYAALETRMNDAMFMPGKDATDEDKSKFMDRLGRPATAGDYKAPEIEGTTFSDDRLAAFYGPAHAAGLTQAQVDAVLTFEASSTTTAREAAVKAHTTAHGKLETDWGDDAVANYEAARRVGMILFNDDARKALNLSDDVKDWQAPLVSALAEQGATFADHKMLGRASSDMGKSDDALIEEADKLMMKPSRTDAEQARIDQIYEGVHGTAVIGPGAGSL